MRRELVDLVVEDAENLDVAAAGPDERTTFRLLLSLYAGSALAMAGTYPVDDQRLRSDLSQVASVALKWLERVDDADAKGVAAD